ncbi:MAG: hypothetical protein U9R39_00020, partial [Campylobacterota bacterium]|nr:hypothetical protein [Campylobacterota bacterium]
GLLKAKETLDYLNMPDDEKIDYERRQENLRREASVYESTYIAGGIEATNIRNIEIAKSLIEQKVSIDIIKLSTGLNDMELANLTNQ